MTDDIGIRRAYREDQRNPYYSIQGGRSKASMREVRERCFILDRRWKWGHFEIALRNALKVA